MKFIFETYTFWIFNNADKCDTKMFRNQNALAVNKKNIALQIGDQFYGLQNVDLFFNDEDLAFNIPDK